MKKLSIWLWLLLLPFVISANPIVYDADYAAQYQSPEGIRFLSYTKTWNEESLQSLYKELLRNKHGKELASLREVRVYGAEHPRNIGEYNPATRVITLYEGDAKRTTADMRRVLSHEYGHHFAFYYAPQHILPIQTEWKQTRGAEEAISAAFWKYRIQGNHQWFTSEIFADDYAMLYGATDAVSSEAIADDTVFQQAIQHENQSLPNVWELPELQAYMEHISGLPIEQSRFLQTPKLAAVEQDRLQVQATKRGNVMYRFNFDYYEGAESPASWMHRGSWTVTTPPDFSGTLSVPLKETLEQDASFSGTVRVTVQAVDVETNLGLTASLGTIHYTPDTGFTK